MEAGTFLDAGRVAVALLGRPEVAARWSGESVLPGMSVGGLAAHLARAILTVDGYLDGEPPAPSGPVLDSAGYYGALAGDPDRAKVLHAGVVERAETAAAAGPVAVEASAAAALDRLAARLPAEPATRLIGVVGELVLTLAEYLDTRVVELAVHLDDLALSAGLDPEQAGIPEAALDLAGQVLFGWARATHGPLAVLRALSRAERDPDQVLRVL